MIKIVHKDGEFLVKGTFFLGIAGINENKEYGDSPIGMSYDSTLEDILDILEEEDEDEEDFMFGELLPILKQTEGEPDKIAEVLTNYYNQYEEMIKKNEKQVNNCFLIYLFENLVGCSYPFWEIKEAILPEYQGKYSVEEYEKLYSKYADEIYSMHNEYDRTSNDGSIEKADVYERLKEMFPMFNFEGLIKSIQPEGITFNGRFVSVQFSDGWGERLFCCAYNKFDENLTPMDWHNH